MESAFTTSKEVKSVKRRRVCDGGQIMVRRAVASDVPAASEVVYEAFRRRADETRTFTGVARTPAVSKQTVEIAVASGNAFVACDQESNKIIGFNNLVCDNAPAFYGIGPLAVASDCQHSGVGRELLLSTLDHVDPAGHTRLMVDANNPPAFALYVKSGFEPKSTVAVIERPPSSAVLTSVVDKGVCIRTMETADIEICARFCKQIARCCRLGEIRNTMTGALGVFGEKPAGRVALKDGEIVGYTTGLTYSGHTVCQSVPVAMALFEDIQSDKALQSSTFRVFMPCAEQPELLSWCLKNGWLLLKHCLLMVRGSYETPLPSGVFIPTADG